MGDSRLGSRTGRIWKFANATRRFYGHWDSVNFVSEFSDARELRDASRSGFRRNGSYTSASRVLCEYVATSDLTGERGKRREFSSSVDRRPRLFNYSQSHRSFLEQETRCALMEERSLFSLFFFSPPPFSSFSSTSFLKSIQASSSCDVFNSTNARRGEITLGIMRSAIFPRAFTRTLEIYAE